MVEVHRISLTNFRSWEHLDLEFSPGVNALVGPNGQGKTNIVEAIGYLATLGSHRVATDAPLVRRGTDSATVSAEIIREGRSTTIELQIVPGRANRARINRGDPGRAASILGILTTVVFAPEDLILVKGDPGDRRRFLDDLLVQRQPRLAGVRSDYDRVLRQRNTLLKSSGSARRSNLEQVLRTLEGWDLQVASLGAEIMVARRSLIESLAPHAAHAYAGLAPESEALSMAYTTSLGGEEPFPQDEADVRTGILERIEARRTEELDRGVTLVGPHRDELLLTLGPSPVRGYASHGESWSAALALRLASFDLLAESGTTPVLILDDVLAELDARRRRRLTERIRGGPQVVVTAAVAEDVPEGLAERWFDVGDGMVSARG